MDQYKILGRIGEGAHGIVFKAKHKEVYLRTRTQQNVPPILHRCRRSDSIVHKVASLSVALV